MAVEHGNADALAGDDRAVGRDNRAVHHLAPDAQGLLLALLLLAADVGDYIAHHLGPVLEGLARAGNRLVGGGHYLHRLELLPGGQHGSVALDGAVRLYGHEAALCAQALPLGLNHLRVLRIDLRHHHGHVRRPSVGAVVGDHGGLGLCVGLLDLLDFILGHVHGAEHEIHLGGHGLHLVDVHHDQLLHGLRHGRIHLPSALHGFLIGLARGAGACRYGGDLEPGVVLQQGDEPLPHHTCAA